MRVIPTRICSAFNVQPPVMSPLGLVTAKCNSTAPANTTKQANALLDTYDEAILHFTPNDISYIIIKNEDERTEFINFLNSVKGKNYKDDVPRLTSRILTTELIDTDF